LQSSPNHTRIGQLELLSAVQSSTAGILYRAWYHGLAMAVAVAEYAPAGLARRLPDDSVEADEASHTTAFEAGLQAFMQEARTLARCEHPSLLRVLQLVQARGTAYRVMPWYAGRTMPSLVGADKPLDEPDLRGLLDDLLGALQAYHRHGGLHGQVQPDRLLLLDDGRPLLLGPDLAARAMAALDATPAMDATTVASGPLADLQAVARLARGCMGEPAHALRYSPALLQWLQTPFQPDSRQQPQSAAQFRQWLVHSQTPSQAPTQARAPEAAPAPPRTPATTLELRTEQAIRSVIASIPERAATALAAEPASTLPSPAPMRAEPRPPRVLPPPGKRHALAALLLPLLLAMALAAAATAWWLWGAAGKQPPEQVSAAAAQSAQPPSPPSSSPSPPALPPQSAAPTAPAETAPSPLAPSPGLATAVSAVSAASVVPAVHHTPREHCGARTAFSLYRCMQQQCQQPRWQKHAECVRLRQTDTVD
jgi:non-specific serine/threonine protein kinase